MSRSRRRRIERRGRPRKANARHRATTRAGRQAPPDHGTAELRRRKIRATTRDNIELNGAGVLFGRNLIDVEQYNMLTTITLWLERLARAWGGLGGVHALWLSIVGAMVPTAFVRPQDNTVAGLADGARRALVRALRELDGSRALIVALAENQVPPLVLHVLEGQITPADEAELVRLRLGLDHLAARHRRYR
jgi:hypothetical protein